MATSTGTGFSARMQTLASAANPAFAVGVVAVPLAILAATYAMATNGEWRGLFYVHVATGALWFSVAVFFPAVLGPAIGSLDPPAAKQFSAAFTPKVVFFMTGISLTAVLSGTLLADTMGMFDLANPLAPVDWWVTVALAAGWVCGCSGWSSRTDCTSRRTTRPSRRRRTPRCSPASRS
ncbi:hypothetical protein [Halomarina rubra]|uniref:Uncharacterized protein n=1 Tax=Halomarina rubra TaxID=2071873 RepID=A0ABD6B093_9EURY|nr:hypothetical protein [Halomarina rubra]